MTWVRTSCLVLLAMLVALLVTPRVGRASVGVPPTIAPTSANVPPLGTQTFSVSSGGKAPFAYSLSTNASGGSVNAVTGVYTAGAIGSVTDVVKVTDANNATDTANVNVGPVVTISGTTSTPPSGSLTFGAVGGSGTGYSWALPVNASGGSIVAATGVYTAGPVGSVTDTVRVLDSLGNEAKVFVSVGPGITAAPGAPNVVPRGGTVLVATGGSGTSYAWTLSSNASGGSITPAGAYTAGSVGSVTDVARVVDSLGNVGTASIAVGPGVSVDPALPSAPPEGALALTAAGGSGVGYVWSLTTNASGGSIVAGTGAYTAGATPNVTDTVQVVDSLGNTGTINVSVGAGVAMSPAMPSAPPRGAVALTATGGSGTGYTWTLTTNNSGGSIVASTGAYTAGPTGSVMDVVTVTDSLGNRAEAQVTVGAAVALTGNAAMALPGGRVMFSATGGSGSYTWGFATNASGGTISMSGVYTAGQTPDVHDIVRVTDSLGSAATATVAVTRAPAAVDAGPAVDAGRPLRGVDASSSGTPAADDLDTAISWTGNGCGVGPGTTDGAWWAASFWCVTALARRRRRQHRPTPSRS